MKERGWPTEGREVGEAIGRTGVRRDNAAARDDEITDPDEIRKPDLLYCQVFVVEYSQLGDFISRTGTRIRRRRSEDTTIEKEMIAMDIPKKEQHNLRQTC